MIVLDQHLRQLAVILTALTPDHGFCIGFLSQHISAVPFVGKDRLDCRCCPARFTFEIWNTCCVQPILDHSQAVTIQVLGVHQSDCRCFLLIDSRCSICIQVISVKLIEIYEHLSVQHCLAFAPRHISGNTRRNECRVCRPSLAGSISPSSPTSHPRTGKKHVLPN